MLTENDRQEICERASIEGFDYCFIHYSRFNHIPDSEFHKLRTEYILAHERLEKYIGLHAYEEQ